jgi:tetratricopeptide (TPR) repeat protein
LAKARRENAPTAFAIRFREVSAAALTEHAKLTPNTFGTFSSEAAWRDAEKNLLAAIALREEILKADPVKDLADREVARAHERLGDLHADFNSWDSEKFSPGNPAFRKHLGRAIASYDRSLDILAAAKEREPNNAGIRYDLVAGLQRKGAALHLLGPKEEVERVYASAQDELDHIKKADPDSHVWLQASGATKFNWGKLAVSVGDWQGAVSHLLEAKSDYDRIARYVSSDEGILKERLETYHLLYWVYRMLKNDLQAGEVLTSCREQISSFSKRLQDAYYHACQ